MVGDYTAYWYEVYTQMPDVRCRMSDVECRMSDVGCRMSDVGCRMSDVGCRIFATLLSDFVPKEKIQIF